jgi:hypothetical protein
MSGLNGDNGIANRSDPWDSQMDPGRGEYNHARERSIASGSGTLESPYDDLPREPVPQHAVEPSGHTTLSNRSQYDEYSDPYYKPAK